MLAYRFNDLQWGVDPWRTYGYEIFLSDCLKLGEAESSNSEQYFKTIPINSRILQGKHLKMPRELQECDLKDIKPIVAFGPLFDPKVLHRQARKERNPFLATGKYGVLIKKLPLLFFPS